MRSLNGEACSATRVVRLHNVGYTLHFLIHNFNQPRSIHGHVSIGLSFVQSQFFDQGKSSQADQSFRKPEHSTRDSVRYSMLVLLIGDLHVPARAPDIPQKVMPQ